CRTTDISYHVSDLSRSARPDRNSGIRCLRTSRQTFGGEKDRHRGASLAGEPHICRYAVETRQVSSLLKVPARYAVETRLVASLREEPATRFHHYKVNRHRSEAKPSK